MISSPFSTRGAEMAGAADRVALIEVVGLHPALQQAVHQRLHHRRVVVDALEQHRLAAQRNAGIGQPRGRFGHLGRQFVGMGEMDAHPQRMMLLQHLHQILGDALRQHGRDLGADAQELDVLDRAQPAQQPVELVVADGQRIAAREQHVANFGVCFEIGERLFPLRASRTDIRRPDCRPRASACNSGNRSSRCRWSGTARGRDSGAPGPARRCRGPRPADRRPRPAGGHIRRRS